MCRFHFLRDLGKDMMETLHNTLGKIISDSRIRSKLRKSIEHLPEWNDSIASEIEGDSAVTLPHSLKYPHSQSFQTCSDRGSVQGIDSLSH